jgi:threonine dehydrogenase-like Zn-dependent dehydrogenase
LQYPTAIELLQEGLIDVKPMITHRFGFDNIEQV